jgi:hypothetical protein
MCTITALGDLCLIVLSIILKFFAFFTVLWHVLFKFVLAMDNVDGFHIFGEEVQMNHGEEIQEVQEVNPA